MASGKAQTLHEHDDHKIQEEFERVGEQILDSTSVIQIVKQTIGTPVNVTTALPNDNSTLEKIVLWALSVLHNAKVVGKKKLIQVIDFLDTASKGKDRYDVEYMSVGIDFDVQERAITDDFMSSRDLHPTGVKISAKAKYDGVALVRCIDSRWSIRHVSPATKVTVDGVEFTNTVFEFVNDEEFPGPDKYYGTDSEENKGYHPLPLLHTYDADMSVTKESDVFHLVNDKEDPGANEYYGTNGSDIKGFFPLPNNFPLIKKLKTTQTIDAIPSTWIISDFDWTAKVGSVYELDLNIYLYMDYTFAPIGGKYGYHFSIDTANGAKITGSGWYSRNQQNPLADTDYLVTYNQNNAMPYESEFVSSDIDGSLIQQEDLSTQRIGYASGNIGSGGSVHPARTYYPNGNLRIKAMLEINSSVTLGIRFFMQPITAGHVLIVLENSYMKITECTF